VLQRQHLSIALAAIVWLCPLWLGPTAIVSALLWGAAGLGGLLLLDATATPQSQPASLQKLFWALLLSLGLMIAWRSYSLQNTLAASLSLASIGLAATLTAKADQISPAKLMAWGWLVAGLFNAALGLMQYFGWTDEPLGTAFGFLRQRNNFATLCNIALIALIYLWHQKQLRTALAASAALLVLAGLAATTSRAGLLGLIAIALAMSLSKNLRKAAALLVLAYAFFAWALPQISHSPETIVARVSSTTEGGQFQDSRRLMWDNTLALIRQQPLLGVGWREIDHALHLTNFGATARFPGQVDNAHNLPLQFAAELGVPFTAIWLCALVWLILRYKPWRTRAPELLLGWGILLVIGIHSLLEYPLWYAPFQIATGLASGLVFTQKKFSLRASTAHMAYGLAGTALLIFVAYAAFDYHRVRQLFIPDAERSPLYRTDTRAQAEQSWLFAAQVRYAKLSTMTKSADNAPEVYALAQEVLHFSAEPWVFKILIDAGDQLAPHDAQIAAAVAVYKRQLPAILAADAVLTAPPTDSTVK
jgi:O-antigen ligase